MRLEAVERAVIEEEDWEMPSIPLHTSPPGPVSLKTAPVVSPELSVAGLLARRPRTPSPARARQRRRTVGGSAGASGSGGASGSAGRSQVLVDRSTLHTLANTCLHLYDAIWDLLEPQDASSTPGS